jgi:hypothetical protein
MTMPSEIPDISKMGDDQFSDFIHRHLSGEDELWEDVLLSPALGSRTKSALAASLTDLNNALAVRSAEMDALPHMTNQAYRAKRMEWQQWRARTLRKRGMVERRLQQAKTVGILTARQRHEAQAEAHTISDRRAASDLAVAIAAHKAAMEIQLEGTGDPDDADLELWDMLDTVMVPFHNGHVSVRTLIANGTWHMPGEPEDDSDRPPLSAV